MARLTVEDCLENFDNRFGLILEASKRARQLEKGAEPVVEWDNDKPTVVALREIAAGYADLAEQEEARMEVSERGNTNPPSAAEGDSEAIDL